MDLELRGKNVLITGASKGIGYACAAGFAAEGCSLRELGNQIRHQRACAMLGELRQSISTIAYRLGYSDVANFSHAFRRAAGLSPRTYRNSQAARN